MSTKVFRIEAPESPWGDYGDILRHGMTSSSGSTEDGVIRLERTGPFMPSVTFPGVGDVLVTTEMRGLLEKSGLTGIGFLPVHKSRIVRLDWHLWNQDAEIPAEYPESGEPEDYVLDRPHCAETAKALGDLWALDLDPEDVEVREKAEVGAWLDAILIRMANWSGVDFFRGTETRYGYVSERAREWLTRHAPGSVDFVEVELVP